jgi:hypothetical protein
MYISLRFKDYDEVGIYAVLSNIYSVEALAKQKPNQLSMVITSTTAL